MALPNKITYADKEDNGPTLTPTNKKVSASDLNEIKNASNELIDTVDNIMSGVSYYVDVDYSGAIEDGSLNNPFKSVQTAIVTVADGSHILLKNKEIILTAEVLIDPAKGFILQGIDDNTVIKYASYVNTNGKLFHQSVSSSTAQYSFENIEFANAGDNAIYIRSSSKVIFENCKGYNNGWSGNRLNTKEPQIDTWANGGILGSDSTQADLQSFWASSETSNGGVMRIRDTAVVSVLDCEFYNNLRGLRIQDCGVGGFGYISRNQCYNNIESGIYLASGAYDATTGCENFTVYNNACSYNSNNGILVIGGINNTIALNKVIGNWNAGCMVWHCSNTRVREMDLSDNNRSQYNGIGNIGDAQGTLQISGGTINPSAKFIVDVLNSQVNDTGLGANVVRCGLIISADVSSINDRAKSIINIDNVGFTSQDYALDVLCDLDLVRLTLGDCRYLDTQIQNVRIQGNGSYYELPYSNHHTNAKTLDFSVDATGSQIAVRETPTGPVINYYGINTLHAVGFGTEVRILLRNSNKIQFDDVPVSGISINGTLVNAVLGQALLDINDYVTGTVNFASAGDPVVGLTLVGTDLTIILDSGTSFTQDLSQAFVDTNTFLVSAVLVGTDVVMTMSDTSTVILDAVNMVNGSQLTAVNDEWFISYGVNANTAVNTNTVDSSVWSQGPFYFGKQLIRGEEFRFNHSTSQQLRLGIWDGAEVATAYNAGMTEVTNFSTCFAFVQGTGKFIDSSNTDVSTYHVGGYTVANNAPLSIRFGQDNHLTLLDLTGGAEVIIGKTQTPLAVNEFNMQMGSWSNAVFPNAIVNGAAWTIVHDFDNSEGSIIEGIEQSTVIRSTLSILAGEQFVFNLNMQGQGNYFGTGYTNAASGISTAEEQLEREFVYETNESVLSLTDWNFNTLSPNYFLGGGSTPSWRKGSAGNVQGMFSLHYLVDNSLEIWSETENELIATAFAAADGNAVQLYFGANAAVTYADIPTVSKQIIGQGSQPIPSFAPDVTNQSYDIHESQPFNVQIVTDSGSENIINQYIETDAPAWALLNQHTGQFIGTAPAPLGATVINCKASNVIGGATDFTVTLNVVDPVYKNLKSIKFDENKYMRGSAIDIASLGRVGNGSGASDAWTIFLRYKPSGDSREQTLFHFGGDGVGSAGYIKIQNIRGNEIKLIYGDDTAFIQRTTNSGQLTEKTWSSIMVVYTGAATGNTIGDIQDYYDAFDIYIDGVLATTDDSEGAAGYHHTLPETKFYIGRDFSNDGFIRNGLLNQAAIFSTDKSADAVTLHNANVAQDLSGVSDIDHYWEPEDNVLIISDISGFWGTIGTIGFSSSDLVNDVPI